MNKDLFIEQPEFEKVARRVLDEDATKWTKQILDEFFTEFPFFMSYNIDLQFKKRDDKRGYAVGTITVNTGNQGMTLAVPLIVTNYQLAPFDVVYRNGVTLPLTEETLGALVNAESAFKQVVKLDSDSKDVDALFDKPLVDLQPAPRLGKYASVIDRISDTITKEHKKTLLDKLASNPTIRAGFEANGTLDVLAKIAQVIPKPGTYFKDSLSKVLPRDIHMIEKVGRFKYTATFGNSQIDDPVIIEMTEGQANDYTELKACGVDIEKKAVFSSTKGAAFKVKHTEDSLVVMNIDGMRKYAYLKVQPSSANLCGDTFGGEMPEKGDYGIWSHGNEAIGPFEITGMIKSASHYEVKTYDGAKKISYFPIRGINSIQEHEKYANSYYLPASYSFVKIGEPTDISREREPEFLPKNFYQRDDVGFYTLQGPVFNKYGELGHNTTSLTLPEAKWVALQCRASKRAIEKMANAPVNVRIPFMNELRAPYSLDKTASLLSSEYEKHSKTISVLAQDLIKEAASIADPQSVDAILALNMITKENVLEFAYQLPTYEQVLSDLAKMVLMVRLGMSTIPEMALVRAMKGLSKVVGVLRGMSKLNNVR